MPVFTTAKGNYRYADLYHNQKTESFLDTHANFFEEIGGVHKEIVYDNTRVAVARFTSHNEKEPTDELLKLSAYYGFSFRFCNVARANEKGHVERSVEYVRRKVFSKRDSFKSLDEARLYLKDELRVLNLKPQILSNGQNAAQMLDLERDYLYPKPPRYDCARIIDARVNKYSCVAVNGCYYSVPDSRAGEFVVTKAYPDKIICSYKGEMVPRHKPLLKNTKLKPGALVGSTAFGQMGEKLRSIYDKYFAGLEKSFVELLEIAGKIGLEKIERQFLSLKE